MTFRRGEAAISNAQDSPLPVLLIEDDQDLARSVIDLLQHKGYVVEHAADGEWGLATARRGS